jgi:hypothetical protein
MRLLSALVLSVWGRLWTRTTSSAAPGPRGAKPPPLLSSSRPTHISSSSLSSRLLAVAIALTLFFPCRQTGSGTLSTAWGCHGEERFSQHISVRPHCLYRICSFANIWEIVAVHAWFSHFFDACASGVPLDMLTIGDDMHLHVAIRSSMEWSDFARRSVVETMPIKDFAYVETWAWLEVARGCLFVAWATKGDVAVTCAHNDYWQQGLQFKLGPFIASSLSCKVTRGPPRGPPGSRGVAAMVCTMFLMGSAATRWVSGLSMSIYDPISMGEAPVCPNMSITRDLNSAPQCTFTTTT